MCAYPQVGDCHFAIYQEEEEKKEEEEEEEEEVYLVNTMCGY